MKTGLLRAGRGVTAMWLVVMAPAQAESERAAFASNDCIIEPHRVVSLSSPVEGVLKKVLFERGDMIKAGKTVARLDARVEAAAVTLASERAKFNQRKVKRNQELYAKQLISQNEKDELETESFLSRLELRQAQAVLAQRTISSPISGVVTERFLNPGEYVGSNSEPIMKIAQLNPLNVEVIVPVKYLGHISEEMVAKVLPQMPVGGEYTAKVVIVDKVIDAASGTLGVRLKLENPDYTLSAGLKCRVEFEGRLVNSDL